MVSNSNKPEMNGMTNKPSTGIRGSAVFHPRRTEMGRKEPPSEPSGTYASQSAWPTLERVRGEKKGPALESAGRFPSSPLFSRVSHVMPDCVRLPLLLQRCWDTLDVEWEFLKTTCFDVNSVNKMGPIL